ncbi:MAG: hypothetical protein V1929_04970 [bacterium]
MTDMKSLSRPNLIFLTALLGCAVLFLALRLRWFGHLLMWDEAMNLCSVRSFASCGRDAYSSWFWHYPPLFNTLLLLARPLQAGFMHRAEWVPIMAGVLQLVMLGVLNRRVFGTGPALWSCLALSVMPGAIFFGLWIKQDCLVSLLGMLALFLCARKQPLWGGLALGFCFLSKEMAVFYAVAIAIVLATERRYRDLMLVAGVAFVTSFWWYAAFSTSVRPFFSFSTGRLPNPMGLWTHPWYYYGTLLLLDLGWFGVALAAAGIVFLIRSAGPRLWPVALFAPAFLIITAAIGKTPWYVMTLFPALATLQGAAACEIWRRLQARFPGAMPGRLVPTAATVASAVLLAMPVAGRAYDSVMLEHEAGMWAASAMSREAAESMNRMVKEGQRALVTPMHYYENHFQWPCPIFVIYLKDMPVVVRPNNLTAQQFVETVRTYDVDWAMVSPTPDCAATNLAQTLARVHGLKPLILRGACIYHTTSLRAPAQEPDNP